MRREAVNTLFLFIPTSFKHGRCVLCISYIVVRAVRHLQQPTEGPAEGPAPRRLLRFCLILLKGWQLFHPECSGLNRLCTRGAPRFFHVNVFHLFLLDRRAASHLLITQIVRYKGHKARLVDPLGSLCNEADGSAANASISVDWAHPPPRLTPLMAALNEWKLLYSSSSARVTFSYPLNLSFDGDLII